jgi:hypothetical protein
LRRRKQRNNFLPMRGPKKVRENNNQCGGPIGPGYPEEAAFAGEAAAVAVAVAIFFAFFVEGKFVEEGAAEAVVDAAAAGVGHADMADADLIVAAAVTFPFAAAAAVLFLSARDLPLALELLERDALADFPTVEVGALVMVVARELLPLAFLPLLLAVTGAAAAGTGGEDELEEAEASSS